MQGPQTDDTQWAEIAREGHERETTRPVPREFGIDLACLAVFALGQIALLAAAGTDGPGSWIDAAILVLAYAGASRIEFDVGTGYTVPTQLVLVAMLLLLPVALVPLLVLVGLVAGALPDVVRGRRHPLRLVLCGGDAVHALAPAAVLAIAGPAAVSLAHWDVYVAALVAQFAVDAAVTLVREQLRVGVAPLGHLRELRFVYFTDATLAPIGLAAGLASEHQAGAYVLVLPGLFFAQMLASERARRMEGLVALQEAHTHAVTDPLTGALNRRGWDDYLERRLAVRTDGLLIALLDIDGLKALNDREGHSAGDELLATSVARWRRCLRPDDVIARVGGDEFAVAFSGISEQDARRICERLADAPPGESTCSVGLGIATRGDDAQSLIRRADEELYAAKRAGRFAKRVPPR